MQVNNIRSSAGQRRPNLLNARRPGIEVGNPIQAPAELGVIFSVERLLDAQPAKKEDASEATRTSG